ncbi:MAG TPA: hypothetical protein PLL90_06735, partial [Bacteroidales bacterium]|nr:hypothetical protein [Bacteroidales bacterium]
MKKLYKILRFAKPYWKEALYTIFFNILSVIFSVVSFVLFIPMLKILFKQIDVVTIAPPVALNPDS